VSLPEGWREVTLKDIGKWGSGGTPKRTNPKYYDGTIPWLIIRDMNDGYITKAETHITEEGLKNSSAKLIPANTLLIAMYGSIGKLGITKIECATNQAIAFCIIDKNIVNQKFVFYYLLSMRQTLLGEGKGGAQQNISQTILKAFPFPLPPLNQQKQIAQKLDQVLARVERIKMALDNTPATIKRFRQSVLAMATSGGLSEDSLEWALIKLENISKIIDPQPSHRTPKIDLNGIPYISTGDINEDGSINFEKARHVSYKVLEEHNQRYQLKKGDFIFGKIGTLGKATALPMGIDYTLSANIILIQPDIEEVVAKYLMFFLQSPITLKEVAKQSNSTSQSAFGIKKMRSFSALFPPLQEQQKIVKKVETLFALADSLEAKVNQAQKQVDRLTQSILAKAFRGEL
jgi:type I restriction enzyme S subunit